MMVSQATFALLTSIKSFFSITKFIYAVVQITDAAACSIWLAGDLAIMLKKIVQGAKHLFEVEAATMTAMPSLIRSNFERRQCPSYIIGAHLAPVQVSLTTARSSVTRPMCIIIAQSKHLHNI